MSGQLSKVEHILGFLSKLVLAFFICFTGFIAASVGYQILTSIDFSSLSGIVALILFYLAIMVVIVLSYKVLTSGSDI